MIPVIHEKITWTSAKCWQIAPTAAMLIYLQRQQRIMKWRCTTIKQGIEKLFANAIYPNSNFSSTSRLRKKTAAQNNPTASDTCAVQKSGWGLKYMSCANNGKPPCSRAFPFKKLHGYWECNHGVRMLQPWKKLLTLNWERKNKHRLDGPSGRGV